MVRKVKPGFVLRITSYGLFGSLGNVTFPDDTVSAFSGAGNAITHLLSLVQETRLHEHPENLWKAYLMSWKSFSLHLLDS